jgi:hypothetical protein
MNDKELEQLLSEDEGTSLDFKRDQYPFVGAPDDQKAELLKDILAFANAWRRTTAYILVGVDEARLARNKPPGISEHLNDADVQQFVNSKTNRPVEFSYRAQPYGKIELGIIEIPLQERPSFLTKDYGKLRKHVVYIRRGSSTDEADPSEVARMGSSDTHAEPGRPSLDLQFADLKSRKLFGFSLNLQSTYLYPRIEPARIKPRPSGVSALMASTLEMNPHFHEDLIDYVAASALLNPVGLALTNDGGVSARAVELRIQVPRQQGLHIVDDSDRPDRPSKHFNIPKFRSNITDIARSGSPEPRVSAYSNYYEIVVHFGNVLPRSTVWTSEAFFLGAEISQKALAAARLYADNLANPLDVSLEISIVTQIRPMNVDEIRALL